MKTIKILLTAPFRALAFTALLSLALFTGASAQINASIWPDIPIGPSGYPNSYTIDYSNYYTAPFTQLTAIVSDGGVGGPAPMLFVNDRSLPPLWMPAPIPVPPGSSPDVVIGNDASAPGSYLVAVVASMPLACGNSVQLFIYKVAGPAPFTAPPVLAGAYHISTPCSAVGPAHIDLINEYSNPVGAPALPFANQFVITWQDATQGIMGYYANLNAPAAGVPTIINGPATNLSSPDVAAIERLNTSGTADDVALFTYVDQTVSPNVLYYQEWDMTTGGISAPVIYDATYNYLSWSGFVSTVRIDAIDDLNNNAPGGGNATFVIVASAIGLGTPGAGVAVYDDITGPFNAQDITSPVFGVGVAEKSLVPQVTCGPGSLYTVGYWSAGNGSPVPYYYASDINWFTGIPTTWGVASEVNLNPWGSSPGFPFGISVSASSNIDICPGTPGQELFSGFENNGMLFGKYAVPPCGLPFQFKHSNEQTVGIAATNAWQLSPNPATDEVTLTAPTGFNTKDGDTYHITDLSGRELQHGTISEATQQIGVNSLPAGMYLLTIYSESATAKTIKFVKE